MSNINNFNAKKNGQEQILIYMYLVKEVQIEVKYS